MTQPAPPATGRRAHLALEVGDLAASVAFYRALFLVEPRKLRPGYAKFDLLDPPLNLALNERSTPRRSTGQVSHLGMEVSSRAAVREAAERLRHAGLATRTELGTTCCYALQDKVWITDPDGNAWEVFTVLKDADEGPRADGPCCVASEGEAPAPDTACCPASATTGPEVAPGDEAPAPDTACCTAGSPAGDAPGSCCGPESTP
jgi:catechol 2,3-dioxygenase-like lactoylglutathione lyase family enzyme